MSISLSHIYLYLYLHLYPSPPGARRAASPAEVLRQAAEQRLEGRGAGLREALRRPAPVTSADSRIASYICRAHEGRQTRAARSAHALLRQITSCVLVFRRWPLTGDSGGIELGTASQLVARCGSANERACGRDIVHDAQEHAAIPKLGDGPYVHPRGLQGVDLRFVAYVIFIICLFELTFDSTSVLRTSRCLTCVSTCIIICICTYIYGNYTHTHIQRNMT